jgi:outer membrane receptor protein involved in Fe transport
VQLNVINLADRQYLGSIPTTRFSGNPANTFTNVGGPPQYAIGAPRTYQLTLSASF